jgi:hypothetical protein
MKVNSLGTLVALLAIQLQAGCVPQHVWKCQPETQKVQNEAFDAEISPYCTSVGCEAFMLKVTNKSHKNLEINWDKTLYVSKNQTCGGFRFEGEVKKEQHYKNPADVIRPGESLTKSIWPNNLKYYSAGKYGGWLQTMSSGENGVYLTVGVEGREISEKLTVNLTAINID